MRLAFDGSMTGPQSVRAPAPVVFHLLLGVLCAAAIAAAVLVLRPAAARTPAARVVTAERGVVQTTVSGSGTLMASSQSNANFADSGQLTHVLVKAGDHVEAGQLLAEIDPSSAGVAVDEAQANLDSAQAQLVKAETPTTTTTPAPANSGRSSGRATPAAATTTTTPPSAADVAVAKANVESAQVSLRNAQDTLARTALRAPQSGTVTTVSSQVGDVVGSGSTGRSSSSSASSSSSSSGSGSGGGGAGGGTGTDSSASSGTGTGSSSASGSSSAFIVITNLHRLEMQVPFSESDIEKLSVGQPATLTINALPGKKLAARVADVASLSTTSSGVVSYDVTFALKQSAAGLKPGMTGSAQVVVSHVDGVVTVPSSAISRRGGASTVTVVSNGKQVERQVATGVAGDSSTEVISGLEPGEQVAVALPTVTSAAAGAGAVGAGRGGGGFGGGAGLGGPGGGFGGGGGAVFRFGGGGPGG